MTFNNYSGTFLFLILGMFISACSPRTGPSVSDPSEEISDTEEVATDTIPDGCETFESVRLGQHALEHYVIYRGFLREGDIEDAYENWKIVYEIAPAADGQRWTVFNDGVFFYENLLKTEEDPEKRDEYITTILGIYDQIGICYPEQKASAQARKAFDLYYHYRDYSTIEEIFGMFRDAMDHFGEETPAFVVNPFTAILVEKTLKDEIDHELARTYTNRIFDLLELNDDPADASWNLVRNYAPQRLMDLERIRGFFDCQYYIDTYYELFENNPEDCESIQLALGKIQWGECPEEHEVVNELKAAVDVHCKIPVTASSLVREAYQSLRDAEFSKAVRLFKQAIEEQEDAKLKADYALVIGKVYYSHLRQFPRAREYAQMALNYRPNWGEPHILIGKLYASSGPLCGPGTGWDSQVVTWVAIDEWEKARSKDPQSRTEANNLINTYRQYMPSVEDVFQRGLQEGESYFVSCWIERETTIRVAR